MRALAASVLVLVASACAPAASPTLVWEGEGAPRVQPATAAVARLAPASPGVRRGPWGDAHDASFQLLDTERAEEPHVHTRHDLTVVLLRGRGTLVVEGRRYGLRTGDVMHVRRGRVHAFAPAGNAIGLAIFTPRLEEPDYTDASAVQSPDAAAQ